MVGGVCPWDDPLQLTGRADVPGADAGRRQAGSARLLRARRGEHGSQVATPGATWVESDHAHCMVVVRYDDLTPT